VTTSVEARSPDRFWEDAGRVGYGEALFRSKRVEAHVIGKQWRVALSTARAIGIPDGGSVLELGCGDGAFAVEMLSWRFRRVDAFDKSAAAVERARARRAPDHVGFTATDVTAHRYAEGERWDGAFLMGFLHHVKRGAVDVVARLPGVTSRVVVLEPNGDHRIRKLLERLPSYRRAGEESFRLDELRSMFEARGYRLDVQTRINLFPPFTPDVCFRPVRALETLAESHPRWQRLCSSIVLGFVRR
jgi:SAM-dependent methyltransferase